ncbi:hypothetical protein CAK95_26575 [Pseudorhodoplanes sinuspersici]|uniref:Uncharacterized protein n=1 Tax=Pseudorhodoplanes sinuspersici TaxID=1235591 RepID=A0A1W6ZYA9_9HYPH|nr:hypothetical protein CAK95_26575 [Pseudorhodoplanes sinuspersici]
MTGEGGLPYSIVKMDDSYVIRVGEQNFLKVNSRRKAAKLISDVQRRAGMVAHGVAEDGAALPDDADETRHPAICFQREG